MYRDQCCVPGCHESGRSHQVLHGFPNPEKEPDRFREWVMAVGGDILGINKQYIYKQRRVCHEHFDIKYCCRYNRISHIAVPTMNMPIAPFHRFPSEDKDPDGFKAWLELVGGKHQKPVEKLKKMRLCDLHFRDNDKGCRRLIAGAVPSRRLPATSFKPMHRFPCFKRFPERFKTWVTLVGGKLESESDWEVYRKKFVCDRHFVEKDKTRSNWLSALTVPTLHIPVRHTDTGGGDPQEKDSTETDESKKDLTTHCDLKEEHNYCLEAIDDKNEDHQKHPTSSKSSFILRPQVEQRKLYRVRHDHGYKVKRLLLVSGASSSSAAPPLPSDEEVISEAPLVPKEEDPLAFEEHEDVTDNKQQLGKLAIDDPLADEDVTDSQQQLGKLTVDDPLAFKDVTNHPQKLGKLALDDLLVEEDVTDHSQQLGKLALDDSLPCEYVTDNPQQFGKLSLDEVVPFLPDKVGRPEPPKNETEVNKPDDPFLPEDPFLPDDYSPPNALDPEIIEDGVQPDDVSTYGDNIHPKLCVLWSPILRHGLTTEARNKILNGYLVPKNCRLFQAPKMNAKIVEIVPEKAMANDRKWATMQQYIGTALTAINRAMESLLSGKADSKVLALRHLSNACLLLSDLHGSHTKIRVKNVTPYLDDTTQEVIKDLERDETVFGNNFIKKWKMAKKSEKPVKEVRPPKKEKNMKVAAPSGRSLVLYSGRWHPPLRKTGKVRRKKVGARVRRQNVTATDSPLPTPRKRRVRQSQVRAPDHPGQHILTSTESESPIIQAPQNNPDEDVQRKLKRPTTLKTYGTKKRKQEEKIDALAPDIETSHIHNMPMEESDRFVQEQSTEEQLDQSSITFTPNSAIWWNHGSATMVTTGAVPLVLPPQLSARDMPTLLTYYDENVPPDPSAFTEIVDDQTPVPVIETDCQQGLSLYLRFKDT